MTWLNRILLALFITAALAFLPNYEHLGAEDLSRVRAERDDLGDSNTALREQIRLLEAEVDALQRDLARIAREDLNMIMPGELVFELRRPSAPLSATNVGASR
jgi:cell division protein FtsB